MGTAADSSTDLALEEGRGRLKVLGGELAGFLAGSEGVFLETGSRVAGLEQKANALVAVAAQAANGGSGEGADPATLLDGALARLEAYLRASHESTGAGHQGLSRMLASIGDITRARRDFEDTARTLRVVGMYIRIESSRPEVEGSGMETVAGEVRRLGELIEPKFRAIYQQAVRLEETVVSARATLGSFLGCETAWSARMLGETKGALESLRTLATSEELVASRTVSVSEQVVRSVASVLVSLQVHDATRQMIEHAIEDLGAFEVDVLAAGRDPAFDAGAWLAELCELCRLTAAQVRGARERYVAALETIAGSLREMASQVADLGAETGRLAGGCGDVSMVEQVQRGVGHATGALSEHLARAQETAAAMGSVADTVQGTAAYVRDIQAIGTDVKIIALNALVETERAGHGGRVLAVLAQAIGLLAAEVGQRTTGVSRGLGEIATEAGGLGRAEAAGESSGGAAIAVELGELVTRLRSFHEELRCGVEALHEGGQALVGEVEAITRRLTDQAEAASALQRMEESLGQLGERAAGLAGPLAVEARPVRRSSVLSRYTMAAERDIHQLVLGSAGTGVGESAAGGSSDGLGDNVELF